DREEPDLGRRLPGPAPPARDRLLGLRLRCRRRAQARARLALREHDLSREHRGLALLRVRRQPAREPRLPAVARGRPRRRLPGGVEPGRRAQLPLGGLRPLPRRPLRRQRWLHPLRDALAARRAAVPRDRRAPAALASRLGADPADERVAERFPEGGPDVARRPRRPVLTRRAPRALALALSLGLLGAGPAALEVEGPGGESVALAPREGRALVVHFWATWCPSCVDEVSGLARAAEGCAGTLAVALA